MAGTEANKNAAEKEKDDEEDESLDLGLHDCLSLGEVSLGLATKPIRNSSGSGGIPEEERTKDKGRSNSSRQRQHSIADEVHRLPLLLRLLSKSRSLAAVPSFSRPKEKDGEKNVAEKDDDDDDDRTAVEDYGLQEEEDLDVKDDVIQQAVDRLEERAALYAVAEGVEVVSCHLAPYVCRRMSKLPPLAKIKNNSNKVVVVAPYDTTELAVLANNPTSGGSARAKRRKISSSQRAGGGDVETGAGFHSSADEGLGAYDDDEHEDEEEGEQATEQNALSDNNNKKRSRERESVTIAAEDSQEAYTKKTLSELALLVVHSLEAEALSSQAAASGSGGVAVDDDVAPTASSGSVQPWMSIEDSILAEEPRRAANAVDGGSGVMGVGSDLGTVVASLMHHVPVLRHQHVASALCQAAVPQAVDLIARMGANCPAAIPSLLRGCLNSLGEERRITVATRKRAIRALADLSPRVGHHVRTQLGKQAGLLENVQLSLALQQDVMVGACLLIRSLSSPSASTVADPTSPTIADRRIGGAITEEVGEHGRSKESLQVPLANILKEDQALFGRTLQALDQALVVISKNSIASLYAREGRLCILLLAQLWVLCSVPIDSIFLQNENCGGVLEAKGLFKLVEAFGQSIQNGAATEKTPTSAMDRLYSLVLCVVLTMALHAPPAETTTISAAQDGCLEALGVLFKEIPSYRCAALAAEVACAIQMQNVESLRRILCDILSSDKSSIISTLFASPVDLFQKACAAITKSVSLSSIVERGQDRQVSLVEPRIGLGLLSNDSDGDAAVVKKLLQAVLEISDESINLLSKASVSAFVEKATLRLLNTSQNGKIPIILPVHLETLSMLFSFDVTNAPNKEQAGFLLQLLYCFVFRDSEPNSPFAVDPRELPLAEVLCACNKMSPSAMHASLRNRLQFYIHRFCPEMDERARFRMVLLRSSRCSLSGNSISKETLMRVLREAIANPSADPCGSLAEKTFFRAFTCLQEATLLTTTVCCIMSPPKSPPAFFTYSTICQDPLVLMKCTVSWWKRAGLRRIVLAVLSMLLESNASLIEAVTTSEETCMDYLSSRNALVVRCLTSASMESKCTSFQYCPATTGVVRQVIAGNPGLGASLLKQGISEDDFNWLVAFCPELIEDAYEYSILLLDRCSLSASERLQAANFVVRICVAYGHRNERQTESLISAALSHLIGAFFLVIGPVGVSVHSLVGDGDSTDTAQLARRTAFRMLQALGRVRGYRTGIRNECIMSLQKFVRCCKGEEILGGLSVPARKQNLLRELQDAAYKAANSMGSTLM